jgi:hypothetical protein
MKEVAHRHRIGLCFFPDSRRKWATFFIQCQSVEGILNAWMEIRVMEGVLFVERFNPTEG